MYIYNIDGTVYGRRAQQISAITFHFIFTHLFLGELNMNMDIGHGHGHKQLSTDH